MLSRAMRSDASFLGKRMLAGGVQWTKTRKKAHYQTHEPTDMRQVVTEVADDVFGRVNIGQGQKIVLSKISMLRLKRDVTKIAKSEVGERHGLGEGT